MAELTLARPIRDAAIWEHASAAVACRTACPAMLLDRLLHHGYCKYITTSDGLCALSKFGSYRGDLELGQ